MNAKTKPTVFDAEAAFLELTDSEKRWANIHIPSVDETFNYYATHWVWKNDSEKVNRQRAIDQVYGAFVAIKNDNYGLKD